MIFTRRFGALRARRAFPSVSVTDVEEPQATLFPHDSERSEQGRGKNAA